MCQITPQRNFQGTSFLCSSTNISAYTLSSSSLSTGGAFALLRKKPPATHLPRNQLAPPPTVATTLLMKQPSFLTLFGAIFILFLAILIYTFNLSKNHPNIQIQSISASPFEISGGRIHARTNLTINLTVLNQKRDTDIVYENIVLSVFYKKELVLVGVLPPFHQEPGEKKTVHESVAALPCYVNNWLVVSALTSPRSVSFSVRMESRIKYFPGMSAEQISSAMVLCENVQIGFLPDSEAGTMSGQPGQCKVRVMEAV